MSSGKIFFSGFTSTLEDTKQIFDGFERFLNTVKSIFGPISEIIGFKVILLFISIIFISAGLSFFGLPRGKTSFFSSLIIADLIWFAWSESFAPGSYSFIGQIISMFNANMIMILPFLIMILLKKTPFISKKIIPIIISIFRKKNLTQYIFTSAEIINMTEKLQDANLNLQKSLLHDIFHCKPDNITLSANTEKYKNELQDLIKKFGS